MKSRLVLIACGALLLLSALLWVGIYFRTNASRTADSQQSPTTSAGGAPEITGDSFKELAVRPGPAVLVTSPTTTSGSWYFTVSGDSRDCGDLVMPKIAESIKKESAKTPAAFYWHLGDLRNLVTADCDMVIPNGSNDCSISKFPPAWGRYPLSYYYDHAWDDFIEHQIGPFGETPFFIGIGNHELFAQHTTDAFQHKFQPWLTQPLLFNQLVVDSQKGIKPPDTGLSYYHVVIKGVDFIYLDNAGADDQFGGTQIVWFNQVVAADVASTSVTTIVVGMHAALPSSTASSHAMDATCQGICSGNRVYDILYQASSGANKKKVYLLASHSHNFLTDIFQTPQRNGQALPGWIVGTAGASQYLAASPGPPTNDLQGCWKNKICYGYLLVEVRSDGTINPQFKYVTQETEPKGNPALSTYCFTKNYAVTSNKTPQFNCACGEAK